jgi:hypothetical protein
MLSTLSCFHTPWWYTIESGCADCRCVVVVVDDDDDEDSFLPSLADAYFVGWMDGRLWKDGLMRTDARIKSLLRQWRRRRLLRVFFLPVECASPPM